MVLDLQIQLFMQIVDERVKKTCNILELMKLRMEKIAWKSFELIALVNTIS